MKLFGFTRIRNCSGKESIVYHDLAIEELRFFICLDVALTVYRSVCNG